MTINNYLSTLASKLVISTEEKEKINTSIATIQKRLRSHFGSEITDSILFGSYTRETILPRKADNDSDIDLMVVFGYNSNNYKPQTYLNKLKDFAETYYSRSEIYQSSPTIVLELNHIKLELVPAYIPMGYGTGNYYIPSGPSDWIFTQPNDFNKKLTQCNANNGYKIKPIVRLIKRWNVTKNYRNNKSFEVEKKIAQSLEYAYVSCSSYIDYVRKAFSAIRDIDNNEKIDSALKHIDIAIEKEKNGLSISAENEIKKVFEDV